MEENETINETVVVEKTNNWLLVVLLLAIIMSLAFSFWQLSNRLNKLEQSLVNIEQSVPQIPQATINAIVALQEGGQPAQNAPQEAAPSNPQAVKISLTDDEIYGDKNAKIAIVEFSDFNCPFCSRFHSETLPRLVENYISTGEAVFVYKDYIGVGGNLSMNAAMATECAREQIGNDKYLGLIEQVYVAAGRKNRDLVIKLVEQYSLDMEQFNSCIAEDKYRQQVADDTRLGQASGVRGTPGFVVGTFKDGVLEGVVISGAQPYEVFENYLERIIASNE